MAVKGVWLCKHGVERISTFNSLKNLLLPASAIQGQQLGRRAPAPVQQTGPQAYRGCQPASAALHPAQNLAYQARRLARANFHQRAAVGIDLQQTPREIPFDPHQEMPLPLCWQTDLQFGRVSAGGLPRPHSPKNRT